MKQIVWSEIGFKDTRGWLLVLFSLLLFSVVRGIPELGGLLSSLSTENSLQVLVNANGSGLYTGAIFGVLFGVIDAVVVLLLEGTILVLMLMGSKAVRWFSILFLLLNFLLKLVALGVVLILPPVSADFSNAFYIPLLQSFLGLAIVGPYFLFSERAKRTFSRRNRQTSVESGAES